VDPKGKSCSVCLVQHDDEIHEATLSVRSWFRDQVVQGFYEEDTTGGLVEEAACQVA